MKRMGAAVNKANLCLVCEEEEGSSLFLLLLAYLERPTVEARAINITARRPPPKGDGGQPGRGKRNVARASNALFDKVQSAQPPKK